jgi:hypothetical protein
VLAAFRAVGWEVKVDRLRAYLANVQKRCDLRVIDLLEISSFGGSPNEFYDGAHVTRENSARIIRHVVKVAPECFAPTVVEGEEVSQGTGLRKNPRIVLTAAVGAGVRPRS